MAPAGGEGPGAPADAREERVPEHAVRRTGGPPGPGPERVQADVRLPGVESAAALRLQVAHAGDAFRAALVVRVPGRYRASVPLKAAVREETAKYTFLKSQVPPTLRATFEVQGAGWSAAASPEASPRDGPSSSPGSSGSSKGTGDFSMLTESESDDDWVNVTTKASPRAPRRGPDSGRAGPGPQPSTSGGPSPPKAGAGKRPPGGKGGKGGKIYEEAKSQGDKDAAQQCFDASTAAMERGEYDKALRMAAKAARLQPAAFGRKYEKLQAEVKETVARRQAQRRRKAAEERRRQREAEAAERSSWGRKPSQSSEAESNASSSGEGAEGQGPGGEGDGPAGPRPGPEPATLKELVRELWAMLLHFLASAARGALARAAQAGPVLVQAAADRAPHALPWIADVLGGKGAAAWLAREAATEAGRRRVRGASYAVAGLGAVIGLRLALWALGLGLRLVFGAVAFAFELGWAVYSGVFWRPVWFVAWPAAFACAKQSRFQLLAALWSYPLFWWLCGGGWWNAFGTIATFLMAILAGGFLPAMAGWTLLSWTWRFVGIWWICLPLTAVIGVGWFLLVLLMVYAEQEQSVPDNETSLSTEVPKGAAGEVARVLGCSNYYEVLELEKDADPNAVKKAHRKKVLKTHPDKQDAEAVGVNEAFSRVQKAYEMLSDPAKRTIYDAKLEGKREEEARPGPKGAAKQAAGKKARRRRR